MAAMTLVRCSVAVVSAGRRMSMTAEVMFMTYSLLKRLHICLFRPAETEVLIALHGKDRRHGAARHPSRM